LRRNPGRDQALIMLKKRAASAVPALKETLDSEDLWLRIKAVEALASIGEHWRALARRPCRLCRKFS
jgi:hypothetical protein